MSPEQAKGKPVDRRSDIWAFGCVLYEMLTGRRAFDGEDMAEVLGAVVRLEPNWEALPADVPPPVRTLLQGCLVKDRGRRVANISTALFVFDKAASLIAPAAAVALRPAPATAVASRRHAGGRCAGGRHGRRAPVSGPPLARLHRSRHVSRGCRSRRPGRPRDHRRRNPLAITPDGSRLVYVGNNGTQLFVRALDALEPDSRVHPAEPAGAVRLARRQWIGFVDSGSVEEGGDERRARRHAGDSRCASRGATWGPDDTIIVGHHNGATGLQRVTAAGGPTTS